MSLTREELLAGVVRVNDERIDSKGSSVQGTSSVSRDGGERGGKSSRGPDSHEEANKNAVSGAKESLQEFVKRRAEEVAEEMEAVAAKIEGAEKQLELLRVERSRLVAERKQLEKLSTSSLKI